MSEHTPIVVYVHCFCHTEVYRGDDRFGLMFPATRAMLFFSEAVFVPHNFMLCGYGYEGLGLALHFRAEADVL